FKGCAGLEQSYPLQIFRTFDHLVGWLLKVVEVSSYQGSDGVDAFHKSAKLNVLPALSVAHGGISDSLKQAAALLPRTKERVRLPHPGIFRRAADDVQVEPVQLLPHVGAALLAHVAEILSRGSHARHDGRGVGAIKRQNMSYVRGVEVRTAGLANL